MKSPVDPQTGEFRRKELIFTIADDYETVTITSTTDPSLRLVLDSNALADLCKVMDDNLTADGKEKAGIRLFNFCPTSLSLPTCSESPCI